MNDTPTLSQVPAAPASSAPAPAASPGPAGPSPGPPPSKAEEGNWYAKVDAAPGDTRADPADPGDGSGKPPPDGQSKPEQTFQPDKPSDLAAQLPPRQYAAVTVPEGWTAPEPQRMQQVHQIVDRFRADEGANAALQDLVNLHVEEMKAGNDRMLKYQLDTWSRINEGRLNQAKSDPEIGGSRFDQSLWEAKMAIEQFGGLSAAEKNEMFAAWDAGGVSNHIGTLKLLRNIWNRFAPPRPVDSNPPQTSKLMQNSGNRSWYDTVDNPGQRR